MSFLGGLGVSAIGFSIVFMVLLLLIGCVKLMSWVILRFSKDAPQQGQTPAPEASMQPALQAAAPDPGAMTPEALAALTGALAVNLNRDAAQLVIRSVRRTDAQDLTDEGMAALTGALAANMNRDAAQLVIRSVNRVD